MEGAQGPEAGRNDLRRQGLWCLVSPLLTLAMLAAPNPSLSRGDDPVPGWVPVTVGGVMLMGGVLFVLRHIHDHGEPVVVSPRERAHALTAYVSTVEERAELDRLQSKEEVQAFLDLFFERRDPTPETPENEFRDELVRRFNFANRNFEDQEEGWKSDAGRIHILFGPPQAISRASSIEQQADARIDWKTAEFWEYDRKAGGNPFPLLFEDEALFDEVFHIQPPSRGRMLFVFAQRTMGGRRIQVYSTEPGERIDPHLLHVP